MTADNSKSLNLPMPNDISYLTPLTKREYFAAMAMQGLLAAGRNDAAVVAPLFADELLQQLEKQ